MRIPRWFTVVLTAALASISPIALHAQIIIGGPPDVGFSNMVRTPGFPCTFTYKSTTVQKLANGITITRETFSKRAEDSSGRTYYETQQPGDYDSTTVHDPVSRTIISWNSGRKVAHIVHQPGPARASSPPLQPPGRAAVPRLTQPPAAPPQSAESPAQPKPQVESRKIQDLSQVESRQFQDLGTRTILGLTVNGQRFTQTFPTGSVGNDQPFTATTDIWFSPDAQTVLLEIHNDPRYGTLTWRVTDFQRGEPDPSVFGPPKDYTIEDSRSGQPN